MSGPGYDGNAVPSPNTPEEGSQEGMEGYMPCTHFIDIHKLDIIGVEWNGCEVERAQAFDLLNQFIGVLP